MSLSMFDEGLVRARLGGSVLLFAVLASCGDPTRARSLTVSVAVEPPTAVGVRQTGVNAGNVFCSYALRATVEGDAYVTARWLNSRWIYHSAGLSDTLETSTDETRQIWGDPMLYSGAVLTRDWGWGGPEMLTPMTVETTFFYQIDGKPAPDSVRYVFECD